MDEIQKYVVFDGKRYVHTEASGKQNFTTDISLAKHFTYDKAQKVINNSISKNKRKRWKILSADLNIIDTIPVSKETPTLKSIIDVDNSSTIFDDMNYDWTKFSNDFFILLNQIPQYKKNLLIKLKDVEDEQQDILHYIEFTNLDVFRGFKAFKMLQNTRRKRRKIKDELRVTSIIINATLEDYASGKITKDLKNINKRRYYPRKLFDLFAA